MNTNENIKNLEDNYHIRTYEESINQAGDLSLEYCFLRYKQDYELKKYRASFDRDIEDCIQEIRENGISKRNIDNHRTVFEKMANTSDWVVTKETEKSPQEIAEFIYSTLIHTVESNNSKSMFAYKEQYMRAYNFIIEYYRKYFEIKNAIRDFKEKHSKELNLLVQEIKESGTPIYIAKYIYNKFKLEAKILNHSPKELNACNEIYENVKDKLFNFKTKFDKINKIDDSKSKIHCDITREEAIERIEYIKEQIDVQNYGILKEEWIKSEYKEFPTNMEERCTDIKRYYNAYTKNFKNLKECSNEYLLKIIELPGIRLLKRHEYTIV